MLVIIQPTDTLHNEMTARPHTRGECGYKIDICMCQIAIMWYYANKNIFV